MMRLRARIRLTVPVILMLAAGCDNVQWGGAQLAFVAPPPKISESEGETADEPIEERLPEGPVLYYVRPAGGLGVMVPIGEISGDTLIPIRPAVNEEAYGNRFIAEHFREGSEFALFRNGARVGTFVTQSAELPGAGECRRVPRATGVLELVAGADRMPEYLALRKSFAPDARQSPTATPDPDRRMQLLAPILAERLLRERSAPLPGNWQRAMVQLRPLPVAGSQDAGFAATFLIGDTLAVGPAGEGHALFFIAQPESQVGFAPTFVELTRYAASGKAATRIVDYLDWNRDGQVDLLLQVFGESDAWFEALSLSNGRWHRVLRDRCESPAPAPVEAATEAAAEAPAQ